MNFLKNRVNWLAVTFITAVISLLAAGTSFWYFIIAPPLVLPAAPLVSEADTTEFYNMGEKARVVKITSPRPGELLKSPLVVEGEAGGWYFEGSFPVELKDENGATLAMGQAVAQGDWMTTEFVPFKAALTFAKPATESGELILKKDNPSGLPANDDQVSVPVFFDLADRPQVNVNK